MMLLHRLTSEDENSTTELLANLMHRKYLRDDILCFLLSPPKSDNCDVSSFELNRIKGTSITTQVRTQDHGQPDLIINSDDVFVVLENKIREDTQLQQHEIEDYVKYAGRYRGKKNYLIFMIPEKYRFIDQIERIDGEVGVKVYVHTWEAFLNYLESLEYESPIVKEGLEYFESFFPTEKDVAFTAEEVAFMFKPELYFSYLDFHNKFQKRINRITELVLNELNLRNYGCFTRAWQNDNEGGLGESIKLNDKGIIFIGMNNPKFVEDERIVYSVCFYTQYNCFNLDYLKDFPKIHDPGDKWDWHCVPLFDTSFEKIDFIDEKNEGIFVARIVSIISKACFPND